MLDVNDFNAIRISLASPDQIRNWSYGEVTKPETINYRTLKPEKDGLFCERIFGPTKDFECYCGKYKRVRYKGIICDKCGVEVTRSKVRRERMGHIVLASPVSHIWFVKGTPSRISLLLDISPRSLERVIYFAQFVVTSVDETARQRAIEQLREEADKELARAQEQLIGTLAKADGDAAEKVLQLEAELPQRKAFLQEEHGIEVSSALEHAMLLEERLQGLMGRAAPETVALGEETIVAAGTKVEAHHLTALQQAVQRQVAALEAGLAEHLQGMDAMHGADVSRIQHDAVKEKEPLNKRLAEEKSKSAKALEERIEELEDIKPGQLVAEGRYRELRDAHGTFMAAGMGAEAVMELLEDIDLNDLRERLQREIMSTSGQRRKKATKRMRVLEAFRKSGNKPEWMILQMLPVLPPDLRPMVQLDGGRFATSDLNDLYRRVINRNNRLHRLLELGAPEIIIRNEKRMLQEAVDSLIDNGRRGRAVAGTGNHKLKSLSDMLKGKQGRFRQNLLGKRVDYSGRSVIVVGPQLKLNQCGLPKRMALELFKPFVMRRLVERGLAHNIKSAKRIVERVKPEVWDVLEEVIKDRPVLLNRAPTLHRLGIQAFEPVLIDGSAIQIHPLVCSAYGADFDGDQMAVHVPLSKYSVEEARTLMMSTHNLLSPSSGEPTVAPTLDMVLGCYYMTVLRPGARGEGMTFSRADEARLAYDMGMIDVQAEIVVRDPSLGSGLIKTTVGRIIFNDVLPVELRFRNEVMDKAALRKIVADCYRQLGNSMPTRHEANEETARIVDAIKNIGFRFATQSGITVAINDLKIPVPKAAILATAEASIAETATQYQRGLITDQERYESTIRAWEGATSKMQEVLSDAMDRFGSVYMMANSGAKGNIKQILQMAGMRGLMSSPSGRIIELPIKSSFQEGLTVLEYFISTHGARKGLADTALRTADSGYLTRRLIDVAQDMVILEEDCGTTMGLWIISMPDRGLMAPLEERLVGRLAAIDIGNPATGEIIAHRNDLIDEAVARRIVEAGIDRVYVRSTMACQAKRGACQMCYGWSMSVRQLVPLKEAVGIIAAQSIGEPGTQLTMRTFHTGGVAGSDITQGLPRVEELFEARIPKGQSIISEIDGVVEILQAGEGRRIRVISSDVYRDERFVPEGWEILVTPGQEVDTGTPLARPSEAQMAASDDGMSLAPAEATLPAPMAGHIFIEPDGDRTRIIVAYEEREEREYGIPAAAQIRVENGSRVQAGDQLTDGAVNPQDILRIMGRDAVQTYMVQEVQKVYRSQGVSINDKHIETIARQMLRRVRVDSPGDTDFLSGELSDRFAYEEENARVLAAGGEPATAETVLLGVTKASLSTDSFLAAASFQETTRVLAEAAVNGQVDRLMGLKENVIIGKLIPAQGMEFADTAPALAAPPVLEVLAPA